MTYSRGARISATFGEDADLTSRLVKYYIRGFQRRAFGPESVSTMTKHFPGGGPQKDGTDPHFANGREQGYPGSNFAYHLEPFKAAIAAGTRQLMPYYGGVPIGTEYKEVGFGVNKSIITGLLREELGFDGIVCTDWGLIVDHPDVAAALVANFGITETGLLSMLFGESGPLGRLPFDLPRSDAAVIASDSDVAFDTENPVFGFGHGLRYDAS